MEVYKYMDNVKAVKCLILNMRTPFIINDVVEKLRENRLLSPSNIDEMLHQLDKLCDTGEIIFGEISAGHYGFTPINKNKVII